MAEISVFTIAPRKEDLPITPYVHIYLSGYSRGDSEEILLSPILMTNVEIDESVDGLIKQLEKAHKKAKKDLQKAKDQLHKSLQK